MRIVSESTWFSSSVPRWRLWKVTALTGQVVKLPRKPCKADDDRLEVKSKNPRCAAFLFFLITDIAIKLQREVRLALASNDCSQDVFQLLLEGFCY